MKTYLDCIPCFVRHCLEAVQMTTDDEQIREQVLRRALRLASEVDYCQSPPATAQRMHRFIREVTGVRDPYFDVKSRFNKLALKMHTELKKLIESSVDPRATAVRLAIAGNIIDSGVNLEISPEKVEDAVSESLRRPLDSQALEEFNQATGQARDILYLGDNAGEIVFDRLLIEQLPCEKITFVVRGGPILNDVLAEDAEAVGLTDIVRVIDNGSDAPGTILADCSEEFRRRFEGADAVIAKGQGNYETLSDVDRDMFFMLQPKCKVLVEHLGREMGSLALIHKRRNES
jgi:uncharacterized protein with ATP-grasp and redox domains